MAKGTPKPEDSDPKNSMNQAKAQALTIERRLKEVAMYETSHGNRLRTTDDEIFEQTNVFRQMLECGLFASLDEIESTVFNHWGLAKSPESALKFGTMDPPSGG